MEISRLALLLHHRRVHSLAVSFAAVTPVEDSVVRCICRGSFLRLLCGEKYATTQGSAGGSGLDMLKAVIFDMDGTLGDTLSLCVESYRRCVGEHTGQTPTAADVEAYFGVSDRGVLGQLLGLSPEASNLPIARFAQLYEQLHAVYAPHPFDGMRELLRRLTERGLRLAVVTGKEPYTALPTLSRFGFGGYFEICLYGDPYSNVKAKRMQEYLDRTGLDADEVIYVGDMPTDIEQAHRAGIRIVCAAWAPDSPKYESACRALQPEAYAKTLDEFENIINGMLLP